MTSAFGGQHSIQLSYGCFRGVRPSRGRYIVHWTAGRNAVSVRIYALTGRATFRMLIVFGRLTAKSPRIIAATSVSGMGLPKW